MPFFLSSSMVFVGAAGRLAAIRKANLITHTSVEVWKELGDCRYLLYEIQLNIIEFWRDGKPKVHGDRVDKVVLKKVFVEIRGRYRVCYGAVCGV